MHDVKSLEFQIDRFIYNINVEGIEYFKKNFIKMLEKYDSVPFKTMCYFFEYVAITKRSGLLKPEYYEKMIESELKLANGDFKMIDSKFIRKISFQGYKNGYLISIQKRVEKLEERIEHFENVLRANNIDLD